MGGGGAKGLLVSGGFYLDAEQSGLKIISRATVPSFRHHVPHHAEVHCGKIYVSFHYICAAVDQGKGLMLIQRSYGNVREKTAALLLLVVIT